MKIFKLIFSKAFLINIAIAIVLIVIMAFLTLKLMKVYTHFGESMTVPNLENKSYQEVIKELDEMGLRYEVADTSAYVKGKDPYTVLSHIPEPESKVKVNRTIYLYLNASKPKKVPFPSIEGASLMTAEMRLQSKGLFVGDIKYVYGVYENTINGVRYKGKKIKEKELIFVGDTVDLVVESGVGDSKVTVPYLLGLTAEEAEFVLEGNYLLLGSVVYNDDVTDSSAAMIYMQIPPYGENSYLRMGEPVDIFVSEEVPEHLLNDTTGMMSNIPDTIDRNDAGIINNNNEEEDNNNEDNPE